jgi:hypothetical protein
VRQLVSKLLAGGLSAGVILLWWPMFFPTDSVTTWLCRGIVWTLSFELLLVAFSPFELALWSTGRGERISQRMEAKKALLDHESPRRRIGRRALLAIGALMIPLALIAVGVGSHVPTSHAATPPKVTQVTRVVRVVKPVRVQRVVKIRTVAQQVPVMTYVRSSAPLAKPKTTSKSHSAPVLKAPTAHTNVPQQPTPSAPTTTTGAPTPSGTQTQSTPPEGNQSGAAASPTS